HRERDQRDPQQDRTERAEQYAARALLRRQVATCERDHDCVVAAEQDVDDDDLENRAPVERREKFEHGSGEVRQRLRKIKKRGSNRSLASESTFYERVP